MRAVSKRPRTQVIGGEIQHGDLRTVLHGEHPCRSTKTATHIEHAHAGAHFCLARQGARRFFAATVKLV